MKCSDVLIQLTAYVDGDLAAKEQSDISSHLALCKSCQNELKEMLAILKAMPLLDEVEPPKEFRSQVMAKIAEEAEVQQVSSWRSIKTRWRPIRLVAALMIFCLTLGYNVYPLYLASYHQDEVAQDIGILAEDGALAEEGALAEDGALEESPEFDVSKDELQAPLVDPQVESNMDEEEQKVLNEPIQALTVQDNPKAAQDDKLEDGRKSFSITAEPAKGENFSTSEEAAELLSAPSNDEGNKAKRILISFLGSSIAIALAYTSKRKEAKN